MKTNSRVANSAGPDLLDKITNFLRTLKLIFFDPFKEIYSGIRTSTLPTNLCWIVGICLSVGFFLHLDDRLSMLKGWRSIKPGLFRDVVSLTSVFWGFIFWGYYRMGVRSRIKLKLQRAFLNSGLETRLKETPQFQWDFPLDEVTRKLRLRGRGLALSNYVSAKEALESNLNVAIIKMENPGGNRELVDIVYTTEEMPKFWTLGNPMAYKDFSFPIGHSYLGEVKASFTTLPHILIAGESGGGKSSFIRMMLTVILVNNQDVEVYFIDLKRGMENQIFEDFHNVEIIDNPQTAASKMTEVNRLMDERMENFKKAGALKLESYNKSKDRKGPKEKRIIVVVDEIAELMPTFGGKGNSAFGEVNQVINRISRMGRAVGINLVIGVQKPDAKNLDPTIKANLSGILCFSVNHFSQSTVVLGSNRASELNPEIRGRAIWKRGIELVEVQTPFLTEGEVADARKRIAKHWGKTVPEGKGEIAKKTESTTPAKTDTAGRGGDEGNMEVEASELLDAETTDLSKSQPVDGLQVDEETPA